ncbi:tRNA epoxyqueuosine(34) reductase QueG [Crocosphaera sp. Alani8]|uniref:tRNA epoxyqueuosine(34) reductase QueG n=1 Tax=Crocosphaera sp. Alani8 TaxID=3038952 RepID=UPI00313E25C7
MQELTQKIKQKALEIGFHKVGVATVDTDYEDKAVEHLQTWLELGYQADMAWMNNQKRCDIRLCLPEAQSVISLALNYYTPHQHSKDKKHGKISRYGWGRDYHRVMEKKLKALSQWLNNQDHTIKTRYYVDTGPVQDKVWAMRSGIGWIAKNGNVITREYGSWVFLGEILTNLPLIPDKPHKEHCGTCTRCISACPTQAIASPFVVNANLCLAYQTIENRDEHLPKNIVNKLQGWIAGCDICQDVCPWNQRFSQVTDIDDFQPYSGNIAPNLEELANIDQRQWQQKFPASALRRIKPTMWRRNARANLETQGN